MAEILRDVGAVMLAVAIAAVWIWWQLLKAEEEQARREERIRYWSRRRGRWRR